MKKLLVILIGIVIFANTNLFAQEASGLWITTEKVYVKEMKTDNYELFDETTRFSWFIADEAKAIGKYNSKGTRVLVSNLTEISDPAAPKDEGFFIYRLKDGTYIVLTLQKQEQSIITFKEKAGIFYDFVYYPIIHIVHSSDRT